MRKLVLLMSGLLVLVVAVYTGGRILGSNVEQLADLEIQHIYLASIPNGTYTGSHTVLPIHAKVRVTVIHHEIESIELIRHFNGQGDLAENILDMVIASQSVQVDVVAGATYSSKVILKAIANALKTSM